VVAGIGLIAGGGYYTYQRIGSKEQCQTQEGIRACARLENSSPSYADGYRLLTTFTNTKSTPHEYRYNSGCPSPSELVNGSGIVQGLMLVCTAAFTTVSLAPNETESFTSTFMPDFLEDGENTIQVTWVGATTPEITVEQLTMTEADEQILRERCNFTRDGYTDRCPPFPL
jgi:hypothetical protein